MIEIAALATSLVSSFIVPLVKEGAESLFAELKQQTTESAASSLVETAKHLWERVRAKFVGTPNNDVVEVFERKPDLMKGPLEELVRDLLENDKEFAEEASRLLETKEDGQPRWSLMGEVVGVVDARHAHIEGGTVAGVIYGTPSVSPKDQ